jgi:hypothetical protein
MRRRRLWWNVSGLLLLLLTAACSSAASHGLPPNTFRVAFISDTHIIDQFYVGPEGTPLDTESLFHSAERLQLARQTINHIVPPVEQLFVTGDIDHWVDSPDPAFYEEHVTNLDIAHGLFAGFSMPVHLGFGNHDYDPPTISRAASEALYEKKLGIPAPYYSVDYRGWRFIHLNCFEGGTWEPGSPYFGQRNSLGSFGETQLNWMDSQLSGGLPTVLMFHIPMPFLQTNELPGLDFFTVLAKHADTVKMVVAGHLHLWLDLGNTYGPPHVAIASTRYDENAIAVADLTSDTHTFQWVHQELWHLDEHGADPWPADELK